MREILFKAKRLDNGEWVEGQYVYINNPLTENGEPIKHLICNGTNIFNCEIDPNTLCQYTGLNDNTKWEDLTESEKELFLSNWNYQEDRKNKVEDWKGKKIWENDILCGHLDEEYPENITYKKVVWDMNGFCTKEEYSTDFEPLDDFDAKYFETCGNIFDNADLLEVE